MTRGTRAVGMLIAVLLLAAGCGRSGGGATDGADPGITDDEIKLGGSYPFSGPASAYATISRGVNAYFSYLNDKGGVNGRKITFITYDDGYEPAKALTNAKRLVEQDQVFALFNTLGTANNLAMWDYTNQQKVPQVFIASGASAWGADAGGHPWAIGWQPDYVTEARIYAEHLKRTKPAAKVGVLYQNDAYGKELLTAFEAGIAGSGVTVVGRESYEATDPTIASQVKKLASSGADVFFDITTPKFAAQAIATIPSTGWKPLHILNNVAASKTLVFRPVGFNLAQGIISASYFKDPDDPALATDPAIKEFKDALAKYQPGADPNEPFNAYGWLVAQTVAEALKQMKQPTRAAFMETVRGLDLELPMLLPGVKVQTAGTADTYPIEAMQMIEFKGEHWTEISEVITAPKT